MADSETPDTSQQVTSKTPTTKQKDPKKSPPEKPSEGKIRRLLRRKKIVRGPEKRIR